MRHRIAVFHPVGRRPQLINYAKQLAPPVRGDALTRAGDCMPSHPGSKQSRNRGFMEDIGTLQLDRNSQAAPQAGRLGRIRRRAAWRPAHLLWSTGSAAAVPLAYPFRSTAGHVSTEVMRNTCGQCQHTLRCRYAVTSSDLQDFRRRCDTGYWGQSNTGVILRQQHPGRVPGPCSAP